MTKPDNILQTEQVRLSQEQYNAIDLILVGNDDSQVAEKVGVTRQTISIWRNHNPDFIAELNLRRKDNWKANLDIMRSMLSQVINTIKDTLENGDKAEQKEIAMFLLKQFGSSCLLEPKGSTDSKDITFELMTHSI